QGVLRDEATLGRLGGEEFAITLPEADLDAGVRVAERIRAEVERHPFQYKGSTYRVTLSLGVAVTTPDVPLTAEALLEKADDFLYQAKRGGRNRVAPLPGSRGGADQQPGGQEQDAGPRGEVAHFSELIRLGDRLCAAYLGRARAYQALGEHDRALVDYDQVIRLDPRSAE